VGTDEPRGVEDLRLTQAGGISTNYITRRNFWDFLLAEEFPNSLVPVLKKISILRN
jgi:hypothetical protein